MQVESFTYDSEIRLRRIKVVAAGSFLTRLPGLTPPFRTSISANSSSCGTEEYHGWNYPADDENQGYPVEIWHW